MSRVNKVKTLCKISLVSIALILLLVSSTALAATERSASYKINETRITTSGSASNPAIYGEKIVYTDSRDNHGVGSSDIYMYDLSAKKETRITVSGSADYPAMYGNKIVWKDYRSGSWDIYMYNLSTKKETQITTSGDVWWGPDIYGDRIVWNYDHNVNGNVYMYDLSTNKENQITTSGDTESLAIYGNIIVYADNRTGNDNIYMYDVSTKKETQITSSPDYQMYPSIYGNKILWEDVGGEDDGWEHHGIYMYDISTNKKMKIGDNQEYEHAIYGNRIVWRDWDFPDWNICMYDLSTKKETQITTYVSDKSAPDIYGDRIVWVDQRNNGNPDIYMATLPQLKPPVAAFSASPRSGKAPLKVQFTDKSANSPTSWKWSFGDKTYSTAKNPVHKYGKAGKYTVSLTVKNAKGSNTKTVSGYIVAKK